MSAILLVALATTSLAVASACRSRRAPADQRTAHPTSTAANVAPRPCDLACALRPQEVLGHLHPACRGLAAVQALPGRSKGKRATHSVCAQVMWPADYAMSVRGHRRHAAPVPAGARLRQEETCAWRPSCWACLGFDCALPTRPLDTALCCCSSASASSTSTPTSTSSTSSTLFLLLPSFLVPKSNNWIVPEAGSS